MFRWYRDDGDNPGCDDSFGDGSFGDDSFGSRPCIDVDTLARIDTARNLFMLVGAALFNRFLSSMSYRKIFVLSQIFMVFVNMLDLVWVNRWNLELGVSDKWFIYGDACFATVVARFQAMPMFVLAAKLCPPGVEATLFALNMGLSNFGGSVGGFLGKGLLDALGGVEAPGFEGIEWLAVITSLTRLLPMMLVPLLIPDGSPADEEAIGADIFRASVAQAQDPEGNDDDALELEMLPDESSSDDE